MRTVIVYRDGETKLRVNVDLTNGILRAGKNILINGDLIPASGMTKEQVAAKIKKGQITPEIEALGMHIGDNGNGLVVRWADEVEAERKAKAEAEYNALPQRVKDAREERMAIEELYRKSYKALNYDTDDMNVDRGYRLQAQATARMKAWRVNYPEAAKEEDRKDLIAQAEKEEELAKGALHYDCDGSFSREYQQERHDRMMAKATDLRNQATAL